MVLECMRNPIGCVCFNLICLPQIPISSTIMEAAIRHRVVTRLRVVTRHRVAMAVAIRKDHHKVVTHRTAKAAVSHTHKDPTARIPMARVSLPAAMLPNRDSFNHLPLLAMVPTMMPRVNPRTSHLTTRASVGVSYARST